MVRRRARPYARLCPGLQRDQALRPTMAHSAAVARRVRPARTFLSRQALRGVHDSPNRASAGGFCACAYWRALGGIGPEPAAPRDCDIRLLRDDALLVAGLL